MTAFFLDSSAIVKRYRMEPGSTWVRALADPATGHVISICEIALSEVGAALAAAHRAPGGISLVERDEALDLFLGHCDIQYGVLGVTRPVIRVAVALTQAHRLRGCDAIQLAAALSANRGLIAADLPSLTLVAADDDLLAAARAEGLAAENPNLHP